MYIVPFTEIAAELGTSLMKNMVAIGASAALLNLDKAVFQGVVDEIFGKKGQEVVEKNMQAIQQGFDTMAEQLEIVLENGKLLLRMENTVCS